MLAMSFAYSANVLVREFAAAYASRFAWIDEACLFGLAWMVFLGLGLALEREMLEADGRRQRRAAEHALRDHHRGHVGIERELGEHRGQAHHQEHLEAQRQHDGSEQAQKRDDHGFRRAAPDRRPARAGSWRR